METTFGLPYDDLKQPKWLNGNGSNIFKYDIAALIQFKGSNSKHGQHRLMKRLRCACAWLHPTPSWACQDGMSQILVGWFTLKPLWLQTNIGGTILQY